MTPSLLSAIRTRLRNGAVATFVMYVAATALAAIIATAGGSALGGLTRDDVPRSLERIARAAAAVRTTGGVVVAVTVVTLALSPLLSLAWLSALEHRRPLSAAIAAGVRLYGRALLVSALLSIPALALLALLGGAAAAASALLDGPDARAHDLGVAAVVVVFALPLCVWAAWHDLSRAALVAGDSVLQSVRRGRRLLRLETIALYLACWLIAAGLGLIGDALALGTRGGSLGALAGLAVGLQLVVLMRVLARGAWLAAAMESVTRARRGT